MPVEINELDVEVDDPPPSDADTAPLTFVDEARVERVLRHLRERQRRLLAD